MAVVLDIRQKQRAVTEFLCCENETMGNIHKSLKNVYGDAAVNRSTAYYPDDFEKLSKIVATLSEDKAASFREVKNLLSSVSARNSLSFITVHYTNLPETITKLEKREKLFVPSMKIVEETVCQLEAVSEQVEWVVNYYSNVPGEDWYLGGAGGEVDPGASGQGSAEPTLSSFVILILAMLLVIGGVELNPGPVESVKCGVCKNNLRTGLLCITCSTWFHFSCQKLKRDQYIEENWRCRECMRDIAVETTDTEIESLRKRWRN
ncbi:hypothetical protein ANN_00662 [Periplaneta americana]|uniref:Zinc finger PHD-type domain-containing protein n=1 Tax=Periplaneta americana TaxID=6978 RepID=A0ABQ8TRK3_PERAM|nr:hypothetical protein ANN_00662 [Periplaneta americana]